MKQFKLTIDCDNAAFEDNPADEISKILREYAAHISIGMPPNKHLYDTNGNNVGKAEYKTSLKTKDQS